MECVLGERTGSERVKKQRLRRFYLQITPNTIINRPSDPFQPLDHHCHHTSSACHASNITTIQRSGQLHPLHAFAYCSECGLQGDDAGDT